MDEFLVQLRNLMDAYGVTVMADGNEVEGITLYDGHEFVSLPSVFTSDDVDESREQS